MNENVEDNDDGDDDSLKRNAKRSDEKHIERKWGAKIQKQKN